MQGYAGRASSSADLRYRQDENERSLWPQLSRYRASASLRLTRLTAWKTEVNGSLSAGGLAGNASRGKALAMKRMVFHVALGLAALFAAEFVQATQSVYPAADAAGGQFTLNGSNSWSVVRAGGQSLVFYGRYTSTTANESGLGLKIQYDAAKIVGVTIDQVVNKCILFAPDITVNGANSQVLFGWADTSQRLNGAVGWP